MTNEYAAVIVSLPQKQIDRIFHYRIPENLSGQILPGMQVNVSFGARGQPIEATVVELTGAPNIEANKIKEILGPTSADPVFSDEMLALARWMRDKYYTTYADCLKCIQPAGIHLKKKRPRSVIRIAESFSTPPPVLTAEQDRALSFILQALQNPNPRPILIHGVTGSGKTEIYMRLIEAVLQKNKQAIVLVPEISLTPQTVSVFVNRFGAQVTVTHSRLSQSERYDQWRKALDGRANVMIGPRSAVFAPFPRLGAIIIDEEHESTYKSENSPKYSAKEVALERGRLTGAVVVMGSATPSMRTYYESSLGLIDKVVLRERVNQTPPTVEIVDMRHELASGNRSIFSTALRLAMEENIRAKKQTILFLNRRGHSTFVSCRQCGAVLKCSNCSVNYTYHISSDVLICHYCGKRERKPDLCPTCGSKYIKFFGVGTQKVEEETRKIFPDEPIIRMDSDTTSGKHSHEELLSAFRDRAGSILIGTQMIAKGLDFPNVTLVGVVAADLALNNGDFHSGETTFQLLTQVAGRAGRAQTPGKVFIQTYSPEHYSIVHARDQNYEAFYEQEIALRRQMLYPPFSHIFSILFSGPDEKKIILLLRKLRDSMKGDFELLGPSPAQISKINNRYRWKLLVKGIEEEPLKNFVIERLERLQTGNDFTDVTQQITMDPNMIE